MNTTLQQRLDLLWSVGASFLADNRFLLYHHLSNWLNRLSDDPIPPWNDPLFRQKSIQMIHWFLEAIPSLAQMDRRSFGKNVHEHWQSRYVDDWSLHERILCMSVLENLVFQALHAVGHPQQHQALHYWFFHLYQAIWSTVSDNSDGQADLRELLDGLPIPIYWSARLYRHQGRYTLKELMFPSRLAKSRAASAHVIGYSAETIDQLAGMLKTALGKGEPTADLTVIPYSLKQETWLIATDITAAPYLKTSLVFVHRLNTLQHQRLSLYHDFKDSLIMFGQSVTRAKNLQETLERIAAGFVQYLPFERVAIFAYSPAEDAGIGMYGYRYNDHAVRKIRQHIPDIPVYQERKRTHQPIFVPDAARGIPSQYVKQFQLQSMVIAPLFLAEDNTVLGAAVLDQGAGKPFELSADTLTTLLNFCKFSAHSLSKYWKNGQLLGITPPNVQLSPREKDALQLMADGLSMSEAAQVLSISEFTVRDYVLSAVRKLKAANRTQAVAIALRMGLIS